MNVLIVRFAQRIGDIGAALAHWFGRPARCVLRRLQLGLRIDFGAQQRHDA